MEDEARITDETRKHFWAKVVPSDKCWQWTGCSRGGCGYGAFRVHKRTWSAHRLAYVLVYGAIPEGMLVCHTCDNRLCVNPQHLFLGTHSDNMRDAATKGRLSHAGCPPVLRGEKNPRSRLTAQQVVEIRQLATLGLSQPELGARYSVHPSAIGKILRRVNWRHIA